MTKLILEKSPTGRVSLSCDTCDVSVSLPMPDHVWSASEVDLFQSRYAQMVEHMDGHNGTVGTYQT